MRAASKSIFIATVGAVALIACGGRDSPSIDGPADVQAALLQHTAEPIVSEYQAAVQELYVAYFGRPADPEGLINFETALLAAKAPTDIQGLSAAYSINPAIQTLVNSFQTSAEAIALYGNGSTTAFVTAIYQHVLGRVPDVAGLNFWVNAINTNQLTQGGAALAIMAGALANTTTQGLVDGSLISNRIAAASYFTSQVTSQNVSYAGNAAAATARSMLSGITATSTANANKATVNETIFSIPSLDFQGISMSTYELGGYAGTNLPRLLKNAAKDGANYVVLSNWSKIDLGSGSINEIVNTYNGKAVAQTARFSDIGPAIAAANAAGLNVMLKPQIFAYNASGAPNPSYTIGDPASFFGNYKALILQWAVLAQQYNVPLLCIGNEMNYATLPAYTPYWRDIIASIRQVYNGKLTYSPLTPQFVGDTVNEVNQIQFWSQLDYGGLEPYGMLGTQIDPTVATLDNAWLQVQSGKTLSYYSLINQLAAYIGKPIIFAETGNASFHGSAMVGPNAAAALNDPATISDFAGQANWYTSFFNTWVANKPSWLAGVFFWNVDPAQAPDTQSYAQGFNFNGKPAESLIASWFGAKSFLQAGAGGFTGSVANDRIYLYGDQIAAAVESAHGAQVSFAQTFGSTVSVSVNGTIINGRTPTVHVYINGVDKGVKTLQNTPSGYVDPNGIAHSNFETFTFALPGWTPISELKIAFDSPVDVGGPEHSSTLFLAVSVNGVNLAHATYTPLAQFGTPVQQTLPQRIDGQGDSSQSGGGYTIFDVAPWNSALANSAIGTAAHPIEVNGGGGSDTVYMLGSQAQYQVSGIGTGTIRLTESSALGQNAILVNIARVAFQDGSIMNIR